MTGTMTKAALVVRRQIAASAEKLFDAWLDPASLAEWMCPGDVQRSAAKTDPRIGGGFEIIMHGKENSYVHTGTYRVIDRPRRLAFTWISEGTKQTETLVTIDFLPGRGTTEIVITHERLPDEAAVRNHTGGWTRILELLAQMAE